MNESWMQVLCIICSNAFLSITFFLWLRAEGNADRRSISNIINSDRREVFNLIREIQCEMKDFHIKLANQDMEFKTRMTPIEERYKFK